MFSIKIEIICGILVLVLQIIQITSKGGEMNQEEMKNALNEIEHKMKKNGGKLSRRDVLKLSAILGATGLLNTEAEASTKAEAKSTIKGKIVIIGGGSAGLCVAARLEGLLSDPDITIIDPIEIHYYQPGFTLVASGIYHPDHVISYEKDLIPSSCKWLKDSVTSVDPDNNKITTKANGEINYDFLVVCPGIQMNWSDLEGISLDKLGDDNIHSVFVFEGSKKTWSAIKNLSKSGGRAIFCDAHTPIKCGGAPKKINLLAEDYFRREGTRNEVDINFFTSSGKMFGVPIFEKRLEEIYAQRDMPTHKMHKFLGVDRAKKIALFEKTIITEREEYDDVLEETIKVEDKKMETIEVPFDFLHFTPPMSAPDFIKESSLAWDRGSAAEGGWTMVDKETLVHLKYKNVISLGDVAGIPINKTGGSIRKQAPVAAKNLVLLMEGKEPIHKHNGYTVCPILTNYGKVLLAEFGYYNELMPTIPILDPGQERWIWWVLKCYILHPMYYYGMLKGIA